MGFVKTKKLIEHVARVIVPEQHWPKFGDQELPDLDEIVDAPFRPAAHSVVHSADGWGLTGVRRPQQSCVAYHDHR